MVILVDLVTATNAHLLKCTQKRSALNGDQGKCLRDYDHENRI
jgi:hypothetical protein